MEFFLGILEVGILIGVVVFFIHRRKKKNLELENNRRLREEEKKKEEVEKEKMIEDLREKWDAKKEEFATDGLPVYATDNLHLSKNEECHFIGLAVFVEMKKEIVGYKGSGGNIVFEILKGIGRSNSCHQGSYITQETTEKTYGTLYLTSKKIIFAAEKNSFVIKYEELVSLNTFQDKWQFQTDTAAYMLLIPNDFDFGVTLEYIINEIESGAS